MKKNLIVLILIFAYQFSFAQGWAKKDSLFTDALNRATSFSIPSLGKGYVIAGYSHIYNTNAWQYDTLSNAWTPIASFPGGQSAQVAFSIGNYAYVGTGVDANYLYTNAFYKYDPVANTWTPIAILGDTAEPRAFAVAFSANGKGFVGGGCNGTPKNVHSFKDFFEYDPGSNIWTKISDCPDSGVVCGAVGFSIGSKGYVGTGSTIDSAFVQTTHRDFWSYDPTSGTWTQEANFGGGARCEAMGFATCNKGYIGCGYSDGLQTILKNDFWQYDPGTNAWSSMANFGGGNRAYGTAFCIGTAAFGGLGRTTSSTANVGDWWEYVRLFPFSPLDISPSNAGTCQFTGVSLSVSGGSNYIWSPSTGLSNTTGDTAFANPLLIGDVTDTFYYTVTGIDMYGCPAYGIEPIIVYPAPNKPIITISVTGDTLISNAVSGNRWYRNDTLIVGAINQIYVIGTASSGNKAWYRVTVLNVANGCSITSDSVQAKVIYSIRLMPVSPLGKTTLCKNTKFYPVTYYDKNFFYEDIEKRNEITFLKRYRI